MSDLNDEQKSLLALIDDGKNPDETVKQMESSSLISFEHIDENYADQETSEK